MCTGSWTMDASPNSPSLGNTPENYSAPPQVAPEEKGKSSQGPNGKELEINLGCPSSLSLVHLHPISVVEQGGMIPEEKSHSAGCHFLPSYRWEITVPEPPF